MAEDDSSAEAKLLDPERDVQARLGDRPLDFLSLDVISNIYRAAAAVRRRAETRPLSEHGLSFGGFTILWVLWVWGDMTTARLADECGLTKGSLTGMLVTLEKRDLVKRTKAVNDRRRVIVHLTTPGTELIDDLFPKFNQFESSMARLLSDSEKVELARLLRLVTTVATVEDE